MQLQSYLRELWMTEEREHTPAYFFDVDVFSNRVRSVKEALGESISLTYSIKANPFLLACLPKEISHVEVCSPGELDICKKMKVDPKKIIYSGVMKEEADVLQAVDYGVDIFTAESIGHLKTENKFAAGKEKIKVILRLTSGNQFGMSEEDIISIIKNREKYENVLIYGIHYYSGTQKKKEKLIEKDLGRIEKLLETLYSDYEYSPALVEYGPGFGVDYFSENREEEKDIFEKGTALIRKFAEKYPIGIEFGRFLAADCGTFVTQVKDLKYSSDTNYVICDGGIHHLKYYGQTMAMQVPPIWVNQAEKENDTEKYCVCGSLCTVADVLVREVELPQLSVGDYLGFERCGAYSVTEGSLMFLSRMMPEIYLYSNGKSKKLRRFISSSEFNCAENDEISCMEDLKWD